MNRMISGQKVNLKMIGISTKLEIEVDYGIDDLDVVLFGLDKDKKIRQDEYTVLFSNPSSPKREIFMEKKGKTTTFYIDLAILPSSIERMMLVASHDTKALSEARPLAVTIGNAAYDAGSSLGAEKAAMLVEIYKHNGEWKLSAIGQGFADGLAKLIEHLGGEVASETPTLNRSENVESPKVNLSKITLEKQKSVSLEKKGGSFGDIVLNLKWKAKQGFFGTAMDLDLGCLYELKNGGKGIVQALGHSFGSYNVSPYIELDGDDRSGNVESGETVRINGRRFDEIERIAIFALIYEGAVKWSETGAVATVKMPDNPEIVVHINDGNNKQRLYGLAIIENVNGKMQITNHAQSYKDQKDYADSLGIKLRWTVSYKD
jgi:tellurite resistance protein TerA